MKEFACAVLGSEREPWSFSLLHERWDMWSLVGGGI